MTTPGRHAAQTSAQLAMDRMYRWQRPIYDLTRKPYLLGRDRLINSLAPPSGGAILEIGCGTGRNLIRAASAWPDARLYGYDVSPVMLEEARRAAARTGLAGRIQLAQGDATTFDPRQAFGTSRFDRIYFSYVLSMIPAWRDTLSNAVDLLEPGAALLVVDFGTQRKMPSLARVMIKSWLSLFNVEPRLQLGEELARHAARRGCASECVDLYHSYAVLGAVRKNQV